MNILSKLLPLLAKNWKLVLVALVVFIGVKAYKYTYRVIAFSHSEVKGLILDKGKCDSLVFVQGRQLTVFNDEVNGYVLRILNDSIRHAKDITIHQSNTKALLQKNKDLEKLLYQYEDLGPCRYPEDSTVGKWPNRKTVTIWRSKPCID